MRHAANHNVNADPTPDLSPNSRRGDGSVRHVVHLVVMDNAGVVLTYPVNDDADPVNR